ncbi:MAG: hypothetical protein WC712_08455 [Candidatus Brocadiia bacterium]
MKAAKLALLALLLTLAVVPGRATAGAYMSKMFIEAFPPLYNRACADGVPKILELGKQCFDGGLTAQARKCFQEVLLRTPNNVAANKYLGNVLVGKKWMTLAERDLLVKADAGKNVLVGKTFVAPEAREEALKPYREKTAWEFKEVHDLCPYFTLYFGGSYDDMWSVARLFESIFMNHVLEFGDSVGTNSSPLEIYCFPDATSMKDFAKQAGLAVKWDSAVDVKGRRMLCNLAPDTGTDRLDALTFSCARGILASIGNAGTATGYWTYVAFCWYFVLARDTSESVRIGYYRGCRPDLYSDAKAIATSGMFPNMDTLIELGPEPFDKAQNNDLLAGSWAAFWLLNHEWQGMYKKGFQKYLKGALRGKNDPGSLKRGVSWLQVQKTLYTWVTEMPDFGAK